MADAVKTSIADISDHDIKDEPKRGQKNKADEIYDEFDKRIDQFVLCKLHNYTPLHYNHNKVIHDPVWGTMLFYPWELQIIDSPLIQRLRCISQVGLTILTYPAARHSRFEHTLGVMTVVSKMVDSMNRAAESDDSKLKISIRELYILRLAALLHDVGHCFFSHLSESIYGNLNEFAILKKSFRIFEDAQAHEIFSYIIINTNSFKKFFIEKIKYPFIEDNSDIDEFFSDVGRMIVGAYLEPKKTDGIYEQKYYLTQIINGQLDADKLDYLRRDSYTAGLALTYDIDRLLYKIRIFQRPTQDTNGEPLFEKHLVIPITGISAVEEMAFCKLMLTSYIYQHQKVLAADAVMQDVIAGLALNEKLIHPCDYLAFCDDDIYRIFTDIQDDDFKKSISGKILSSASHKTLSEVVMNVKHRLLPKRAFTINFNTVKKLDGSRFRATDIADKMKEMLSLRQEICEEAKLISDLLSEKDGGKKSIDIYDIHIVIPKTSVIKDLSNAIVLTNESQPIKLSEVVRLGDWGEAFLYHKWNAYIFARADIVLIVGIASRVVLERHKIEFDDKKVYRGLKYSDKIIKLEAKLKQEYNYLN